MLLALVRALWLTVKLGANLLTARHQTVLVARFWARPRRTLTRPRRVPRSCPRAVHQLVCRWPRKLRNQSWQGTLAFHLLPPKP